MAQPAHEQHEHLAHVHACHEVAEAMFVLPAIALGIVEAGGRFASIASSAGCCTRPRRDPIPGRERRRSAGQHPTLGSFSDTAESG